MDDLLRRTREALQGRFRIDGVVGQGGMAVVFGGEDLRTGDSVAIKVLRPEVAGSISTERFRREIDTASQLDHPNILPILDSGTLGETLYCVMPLIKGEPLSARIQREGQLGIEDASEIAHQLAEALSAAHSKGVVHRDIKPANILLAGDRAILSDFGICRAIAETPRERLTETGIAVGTPAYMSPEQGAGERRIDERSDVYSFGCVLYEMLAGQPPFTGATAQAIVARHLIDQPPPLSTVRERIPDWLDSVVDTCLAKSPADRYATGEKLLEAIEKQKPRARQRGIRRFMALAAIVGTIAVVGTALAIWKPWLRVPLDENVVVVFPLFDSGSTGEETGAGEAIATMLGYALDNTEPLRWVDGYDWLTAEQRTDPRLVTAHMKRDIAHEAGAAWYLDGIILRETDSVSVVVRLADSRVRGEFERAGLTMPTAAATPGRLARSSVAELLPALLAPQREIDVSAFANRNLSAIANWLQGENEYRRSRFAASYALFERAIEDDSVLSPAAVSAARASSWLHRLGGAREYAALAIRHDSLLSPARAAYARGLDRYLSGEADSAIAWLEGSLETDSTQAETWFALAEVYRHLIPGIPRADSMASAAYQKAARVDAGFTPAVFHLVEYAIQRGDLQTAWAEIERFQEAHPDSGFASELVIEARCSEGGPRAVDWASEAERIPEDVLNAGVSPGLWTNRPACAEAAFRAVLASEEAELEYRWGALLGLQHLLVAQGRVAEVEEVLDDEANADMYPSSLYLLNRTAEPAFRNRADREAGELADGYSKLSTGMLWLYGIWAVQEDSLRLVSDIARILEGRAEAARADSTSGGARRETLMADSFRAHEAILKGDTALAIARLRDLSPNGHATLVWNPWEALGTERLLLAELLLAQGDFRGADSVASFLESPVPVVYALYLPAALRVRIAAAEAEGREEDSRRLAERLSSLLRTGPTTNPGD